MPLLKGCRLVCPWRRGRSRWGRILKCAHVLIVHSRLSQRFIGKIDMRYPESLLTRLRALVLSLITLTPHASSLADNLSLGVELQKLSRVSEGKIGICASAVNEETPTCINGGTRFPLQSVMKLLVAATVLDKADQTKLKLNEEILIRSEDGSPGPQEFTKMVRMKGRYLATVRELIERAVIDSDSTSVDVLIDRLGGVSQVQQFLDNKKIAGITISRDERELQSASVGLSWSGEYADNDRFEAAIRTLPKETRDAAWNAHLVDPRDTSTPAGMVHLLKALAVGDLLSPASTEYLLEVMARTATGADRLKAGIPTSWALGHKTGTGRTWNGVTETTNDVGILTAPDGRKIVIAVFVAGSKASMQQQAAIIARAAKLVTNAYSSDIHTASRVSQ